MSLALVEPSWATLDDVISSPGWVPPNRSPAVPVDLDSARFEQAQMIAARFGLTLHPWQLYVMALGLSRDDSGYVYSTVCAQIARQCGKTVLAHVRAALGLMAGESVAFTAQDRNAARKRWLEGVDFFRRAFGEHLMVRMANGSESCRLPSTGGQVVLVTPSDSGPRGYTFDCCIIDEAYRHSAEYLGAVLPTMLVAESRQLWLLSNAGTNESTLLANFRDRADEPSVCWIEWSAPEDADIDDETVWHQAIPSLGQPHGITLETVRQMKQAMPESQFEREMMNRWQWHDESSDRPVDPEQWESLSVPGVEHDQRSRCVGVSVNPDGDNAAVVEASLLPTGQMLVEVIEVRDGPIGWVEDSVRKHARRRGALVAINAVGRTGALKYVLGEGPRRLPLLELSPRSFALACVLFADRVESGTLTHVEHSALTAAATTAVRRRLSGAWAWQVGDLETEITVLEAATAAAFGARHQANAPKPGVLVADIGGDGKPVDSS